MIDKLSNCLGLLNRGAKSLQSPFLLFIRVYWGWQFIQTGWGKANNIEKVTQFFTNLGIPFPGLNAPFIAGLELVGGILLVLGLASRPISLLLTADMLVAYIVADREALLAIFSDPDHFTGATPYNFLFASLIVLIFGAGRLSVDALIAWKNGSDERKQVASNAASATGTLAHSA